MIEIKKARRPNFTTLNGELESIFIVEDNKFVAHLVEVMENPHFCSILHNVIHNIIFVN
jgi:hypothetical protein